MLSLTFSTSQLNPNPCRYIACAPCCFANLFHHHVSSIANGRAQRASARSLNNGGPNSNLAVLLPPPDPAPPDVPPSRQPSVPLPDSDSLPAQPESDDPSLSMSRANSLPAYEESGPPTISERSRSTRKDKGKGKEADRGFRVKEEPVGIISLSPEPSLGLGRASLDITFVLLSRSHILT